jgi:1,4-alpha-glucan branching enzyme
LTPDRTLFTRLHDRDPAVREAAQREIAAEVAARGGDVKRAAEALGISVRTARRWMDAFDDLPGAGAEVQDRMAAEPPAPVQPERHPAGWTPFTDFRTVHGRPLDQQAVAATAAGAPSGAPTAGPASAGTGAGEPGAESAPAGPEARSAEAAGDGSWAPAGPSQPAAATRGPGVKTSQDAVARAAGEWPHHQPEAIVPDLPDAGDEAPRRLAFVLHAHLPWVLGHGTWPHGEDWLAEAVTHCYLPLIGALERLGDRGGRHLLTLSISPVLAAQLADARTRPLVAGYLAHRLEAARSIASSHPLGSWWLRTYEHLAADWERRDGDLVGAAAQLGRRGVVELATCAATHGYLPLLHRQEHVALQVAAAAANHERWFGARPAGMWMPECAYRPAGPWVQPATGATEPQRAGNEAFLAAEGVRWTVVDAHLVLGGEPLLPYDLTWGAADGGSEGAATAPPLARRLQPMGIGDGVVTALPREPHTAHQVWSRHGGYPGDPRYLDFHKRNAESGLRLWQVTDVAGDLGGKLPYHPAEAAAAVRDQAAHFVDLVARVPGLGGGVAVSPYDAELFGHWWFEGVDWLEAVLARCLGDPRVEPTTPSRELAEHPPAARVSLGEGSWGDGGDHRVWVADATAWMWRELGAAEEAVAVALPAADEGRSRAMLAQLMLLAASDWPFLVTTGSAADYAAERFRTHRDRLQQLLDAGDGTLPAWADEDLAGLYVDPAWWRRGEG